MSVSFAESNKQILITVTQTGQLDAAVFRSFNRSYSKATKKYGSELQAKRQIKKIASDYGLSESKDAWTINSLDIYCALLTLPGHVDLDEMLSKLSADKRVESAQPVFNYTSHTSEKLYLLNSSKNYNDPYFSLQYKNQQEFVQQLHREATGKGVKIAVIDTGADTNHADLTDQIHEIKNFVDDDFNQFNKDIHGTAVAGIISARPNNELGIVGLAPDAELWILKACWQVQALSDDAICNSFTIANALSMGIDGNVDIFNLSLAGPRDPLVERLINEAIKRNIIVVAADPIIGQHRYPALLSGVIDVQQSSKKNANSDKKKLSDLADKDLIVRVDGSDILTTAPNGGFEYFSGSSMSTAIVSGLGALLLERDGDLSITKLNQLISQAFVLEK